MINGKYKRIVAYGCSFTAGDELADSLVLGLPEEEIDLLKRSGISRNDLYGNLYSECIRIGKNLSWVRWLADRYNVPYSNRAHPGGSIQQMVYRIERDYYNGLTNDDDLVIVGLTSLYRWFQFDDTGQERAWVLTSEYPDIAEFNQKLVEYYANPQNVLWYYQLHLNYMQMLADKRKNIFAVHAISPFSVEVISRIHPTQQWNNADPKAFKSDFLKTIDSFKYPFILNHDYGMGKLYAHLPKEEATHGYGHPKLKYQKEFANIIADWIAEK